jgi:hypothetical protein
VNYTPEDGTWKVIWTDGMAEARSAFSRENYNDSKNSLKRFLCHYFSNGDCNRKLGKAVCPVGATPRGGKILKVRWALPGSGKSGGLRLLVVVFCNSRPVVIAEAFVRSDDPPLGDFLDAADRADAFGS